MSGCHQAPVVHKLPDDETDEMVANQGSANSDDDTDINEITIR